LVLAQQVHDKKICYISEPGIYLDIDGFYTDHPEIYLTIRTADYAAVFISIPEIPVVGIAHVGWRGAKANIIGNLIEQIKKRWDINSKSIHVAVSSHIKPCCYEVGAEFMSYFKSQYLKQHNSRLYLDLEKVIIEQLIELGIDMENLSFSQNSTSCSRLPLYSYRAQQKTSNRLLSVISIQK
jgi:YfiH family protein